MILLFVQSKTMYLTLRQKCNKFFIERRQSTLLMSGNVRLKLLGGHEMKLTVSLTV